jgi:hypothetical protein
MIEKTKVPHFRKLTGDMSRSINMLTGKRRLQRIEDLQRLLNFERRLAMLTREERASAHGVQLSPAMRQKLKVSSPTEREKIIEGWARAIYIRRCAWQSYLNGETDEKPPVSKKKNKPS